MSKIIVGIDEVGRGPIAGPVAVGAFVFRDEKVKRQFRGVKESKQLSENKREEWFEKILVLQKDGMVDFCVTFQSEKIIDKKGLSFAIKTALNNSLEQVVQRSTLGGLPSVKILLDGGLKAPVHFENQKTIIKGDEKEMVIALASICAKVLRDRYMRKIAKKYPQYGFDIHKGYGTRAHYKAIHENGVITLHRKTFLKSLIG